MKFKEVSFKEMMKALYEHGEDNPISARIICKKDVCCDPFNGTVSMRTFTFSSSAKLFNNKIGTSVFATCKGLGGHGLIRIEDSLNENDVALCYIENK